MDAKTLLDRYRGVLGLTGHVAQDYGATIAGGLVGLGNLPLGIDKAAAAQQLITDKLSPHKAPDAQTIGLIQSLYPATQSLTDSQTLGGVAARALLKGSGALSDAYNQGVQQDADLVSKYLGPQAGGETAALGAALPNAAFPEAKGASAIEYAAHEIPEIAPRARMVSDSPEFQPLLPDGAHSRTLARENAANARRAEEGLPPPDVPPSEFAGRQAEHEAAVAQLNSQPAYIKAKIPATDVSPSLYPSNFSPPDNAEAYVAMDPQTGEHLGHVSFVKRGDGVQSLRMDVAPDSRGQGIGSDLLSSAISDAHDQGLPYRSDTQVSVPAAKTYSKVPGAVRNDDVEHLMDDNDGHVGRSNNGRPVFEIPPSVDADNAQVGETPHFDPNSATYFDPNSYVGSQAHARGGLISKYAKGGEGAPMLSDVARLMAEYGKPSNVVGIRQAAPAKTVHEIAGGTPAYETLHDIAANSAYRRLNPETHPGNVPFREITPDLVDQFGGADNAHDFLQQSGISADLSSNPTVSAEDLAGAQRQNTANSLRSKFSVVPSGYAKGGDAAPLFGDIVQMFKDYGPKAAEAAKPLEGLPTNVSIPGHGPISPAPNPVIRQVAQNYMDQAGIKTPQPSVFIKADPKRAKAIAGAYDAAQHSPNDPAVKASYEAMKRETMAQYQHIKNAGLQVDFIPPGAPDPYAASPRLAIEDINRNNHMWVFPTESGFGTEGAAPLDHPMLEDSGETIGGKPATANDIFRVVHDYFGHAKEGVGFRADGEENAWNQHASMYSDLARPAMTAETRGQNSWVNSGPYADANKGASGAATIYAPQKAVILPDVYNHPDDGMMHFLHMSNLTDPQVMLDPAAYGTGMRGAEARRGGTKTISLYPADINPSDIEPPLQGKTPYRVSVPKSQMYDMSSDPLGYRASTPSYSDAEDAVKDAGFTGYHTPDHQDPRQRGQARLFVPTTATRLEAEQIAGPRQYTPTEQTPIVDDTTDTSDFAKGGLVRRYMDGGGAELAPALDDVAHLFATYGHDSNPGITSHVVDTVDRAGSATYNPTSGDMHTSGYAVPVKPSSTVALDDAPTHGDLHDFLLNNKNTFDSDPNAAIHVERDDDGNHYLHLAHVAPDFQSALAVAKQFDAPGIRELHTGTNFDPVEHLDNTKTALKQHGVAPDMVDSMRSLAKGSSLIPTSDVDQAINLRNSYNAEPAVTPGPQGSDQEWADFGARHGVNMTVTPSQEIHPGIAVPGGLEGQFTIPDLFQIKAQNFNPNDLPKPVHEALMQKFMRTYGADGRTDVDHFNSLNFGLLSPNSPLLQNEFAAQRMRVRTPQDLQDLANSKDDLVERYGLQAAGAGGMGIRGTADPQNAQKLAQVMLDNPDLLKVHPGETMQDVMLRVANAVPGNSIKTSSLSVPFTDLANANTSAVDLHMIRNKWRNLLDHPELGQDFKNQLAGLMKVPPTSEALQAAYDANPGQGMLKVRSIIEAHPERLFTMADGSINPAVPPAIMPDKLPQSPEKFVTTNPHYQAIMDDVNAGRDGLPLFPEQWRLWDGYRNRVEPHEFAHPDWKNLPKQSFPEMQQAFKAHVKAGYAHSDNPPLTNSSGASWKDLYYGHADPLLLGGIAGAGALGAAGYALANQDDN